MFERLKVIEHSNSMGACNDTKQIVFNYFKKSANKRYPLYYAIKSLSAENLKTILQPSLKSLNEHHMSSHDYLKKVQYWKIINEKFSGGYNYIHLLANNLTSENYAEVSEMITIMLEHGCSASSPNDQQETPFYLLLKNPIVENDLINVFVANARIENNTHRADEITSLLDEKGLKPNIIGKTEPIVDVDFLTQHLDDWDRSMFEEKLGILQKISQNFKNDIVTLLEEAIIKNLPDIVSILMAYGVDITNEIPANNNLQLAPAFLACTLGHHEVLKVLINDQKLLFASTKLRRNRGTTLLHQIFNFDLIDVEDRQKCFEIIIADKRCNLEIINQADGVKNVPLHYSCRLGCDEISKELLRRGAYIGHEGVMNFIQKDVLEDFLDNRITCSGYIDDKDFEVSIDYRFLTPPDKTKLEITAAHLLSTNSILRNFILHPVISSFVILKWKKINFIVYINVLIYFGFLLLLGFTVMNFYNVFDGYDANQDYCVANNFKIDDDKYLKIDKSDKTTPEIDMQIFSSYSDKNTTWLTENLNDIKKVYSNVNVDVNVTLDRMERFLYNVNFKNHFRQYLHDYWPLYYFDLFGLFLMTLYELVQLKTSWKNYFLKPINWLDILLIASSLTVLVGKVGISPYGFRRICSVMILLMGAQCIQLFSKVSVFSLSLHLAILRKVSITFVKTIVPYLIILLAFGMSFYALNFKSTPAPVNVYNGFSNSFLSTISTVRMMLSDFGAVIVQEDEYFKGLLLLGFIFAISIVVFNLLNALAISDTNGVMEVAELVETTRQISTLRTYDALFSRFKIFSFNMFPKINTIMLMPNSHNTIQIKNRTLLSDKVIVHIEEEASKFEDLVNLDVCFFCNTVSNPVEFDEKVIKKFFDYVKNRNAKKLDEIARQKRSQELYTMGMALKSLQIDMNDTKNSLKILQNALDGNDKSISEV